MAKVLMCTGKKKKVAAVAQHFMALEKKHQIKILGKKVVTKRALIWSYDELKILFETAGKDPQIPKNLAKQVDICTIKDRAMVILKFQSPQVEDTLLKTKILALSRSFLSAGIKVDIKEEEIRHNDYKIERKANCQIGGPVKSVVAYKDLLIKEDLCVPESISYVF